MSIFFLIYNLLGGFKGIATAAMLFGAVSTAAYYVNAYDSRGQEIVQLTQALAQEKNLTKVQTANWQLAGEAVKVLNTELLRRNVEISASCELLTSIANDKTPGIDDPVHAAINRTLQELRKQGL